MFHVLCHCIEILPLNLLHRHEVGIIDKRRRDSSPVRACQGPAIFLLLGARRLPYLNLLKESNIPEEGPNDNA